MKQAKKKVGRQDMEAKRKQAEDLFINTDMTQESIAKFVGTTPKTLSGWVNAEDGLWKRLKAANLITASKNIQMWHLQIYNLNEAIMSRPTGEQYPTSTEADTLSKMATNIQKLSKEKDISSYINVLDEFIEFLFKSDSEVAKKVAPFMPSFARSKTVQYGKAQ